MDESNCQSDIIHAINQDGSLNEPFVNIFSKDQAIEAYSHMKKLRLLDARMISMQRQGRVGFYGACTGQEVAPVATAMAFQQSDWIFPALRESSVMLFRGVCLTQYLAQVFGNEKDILKGRQMPSHMSARSANVVSWGSCIGTQLPHAVGVAWAAKMKKDLIVTVGFIGDGGTSEPDFHHALNFAGVFNLPCVLVCQNNHWAISIPSKKQTASTSFAVKGKAYGIHYCQVDGNDMIAVYSSMIEAAKKARSGGGATLLELVTYRIGPHSTSDDPSLYRKQTDVDAWIKRDPIRKLRSHLTYNHWWNDNDDDRLEKSINTEILSAIEEIEACKPPSRDSLFDDVYDRAPWNLMEQRST